MKTYDIKHTITDKDIITQTMDGNFEAQRIIDLRYDLYHEGKTVKCKYSNNTIHPRNIESIVNHQINHYKPKTNATD